MVLGLPDPSTIVSNAIFGGQLTRIGGTRTDSIPAYVVPSIKAADKMARSGSP